MDSGKVIGKHNGIHHWTIGQRAKLGGFSEAFFIASKDANKNIIYVVKSMLLLLHNSVFKCLILRHKELIIPH